MRDGASHMANLLKFRLSCSLCHSDQKSQWAQDLKMPGFLSTSKVATSADSNRDRISRHPISKIETFDQNGINYN